MRNNTLLWGIIMTASVMMIISCKPQSEIAGNYKFETQCLGVELDGSQTVKSFGNGRTRADAIEQAKKNGVRDVLFKGIRNGSSDCNGKPLLTEVNVLEKNENYFNQFFADEGPYMEFVSYRDGPGGFNEAKFKTSTESQQTYSVLMIVQRAKLKEKMIQDNILQP